ncbi:universal stress protein [Pseudomonas sp. xss_2]|uniref:universal stress protein n=1 Tax=Pseudomonas sp. xss_2 TaxID=3367215 RepID=UPI00370AFFC5
MPMLKDIAVFFDSSDFGMQVLRSAARLAATHEAKLVGLTTLEHALGFPEDCFARGDAISAVIRNQEKTRIETTKTLQDSLNIVAAEFGLITELRLIPEFETDTEILARCLYCDLVVVGHPRLPGALHGVALSQVLYGIGVPLLILPASWTGQVIGRRITVTWNASRQSRRAIADALPILSVAEKVQLLIVDSGNSSKQYGGDSGEALSAFLVRHGVTVELRKVSARGSVAATILADARENNTDLIVFGAYSRPRITEAILDGVSRTLLADVPLPLLTTH